jgi:hypothetical protein
VDTAQSESPLLKLFLQKPQAGAIGLEVPANQVTRILKTARGLSGQEGFAPRRIASG